MKRTGIFAICAVWLGVALPAGAATLSVGKATIQRMLVENVFTDNGRWVLQSGLCHVYLESPRSWLAQGRVFVEAQLSAQVGVEMSGQCMGSALASKVVMSGRLTGSGTTVTLAEVRFDRVADDPSGGATDLLQSIAPTLPPVDVLKTIRARLADSGEPPISVDSLQIDSVTTSDTAVAIRFDFGVSAP